MHDWAGYRVRGNAVFSNCSYLRGRRFRWGKLEQKAKASIKDPWRLGHRRQKNCRVGFRARGEFQLKGDFEKSMNWEEQSRRLWRTYGPHVLVIFVVVLMVHDIFGPHGFLAMRRKQQEIQKVRSVLQRLNKENSLLEQDVQDLKTDPQTIRKIAREELGLAQPGEIIIKLPAPEPQTPPAARP
jgi:cell division protein FtsB